MTKALNINTMSDYLKDSIMGLVERGLETHEDVGLFIEYENAKYIKPASELKRVSHAKTIFRCKRIDVINVVDNEELKTTVIEVQVVKGLKGEAGKSAKFFNVPLTLRDFAHDFPGYDFTAIFGKVEIDKSGEKLCLKGRYAKDKHLCEYLNKKLVAVVRQLGQTYPGCGLNWFEVNANLNLAVQVKAKR